MASSEVFICNLALADIGNRRITSLDDPTNEARQCKTYYEQTRDEVLRSHPWNFATSRAVLTQLVEQPPFGWCHQYALPTDCLRVLEMNNTLPGDPTRDWEVEGRVLMTDDDCAKIRYIARVTDTTTYDPLFVKALATLLASKIAVNITGDRNLGTALVERYENVDAPAARRVDGNENREHRRLPSTDSDLVRSRYIRFY